MRPKQNAFSSSVFHHRRFRRPSTGLTLRGGAGIALGGVLLALATGPAAAAAEPPAKPAGPFQEAYWPEFRGPDRDGHAAASAEPPTEWSETSHVVWKQSREQQGWSSPVVAGGTAWFTEATADGKQMSVVALAVASGETLWQRVLFENATVDEKHLMNSYASPTPVTDGKHLWVTFGSYGTACLDAASGATIWQRRDLPCNHWRGPGSSPILVGDQLILHYDGFDFQYVVAFDAATGKTHWKVDRDIDYGTDDGDVMKAYATPIVIEVDGQQQLISPTSKAVLAYEPETGEEIWRVEYKEFSATGQPSYDGDLLYVNTGFGKAQLMAIDPRGTGNVTGSHVRWVQAKTIGSKSSQLLVGERIFNVHDRGVASCLRTRDGEMLWMERLGGEFSASPLFAGGHVYLFDHDGTGYVLEPADEFRLVAENQLDDGCMASPVPLGQHLLVRTRTAIYLLGPPL